MSSRKPLLLAGAAGLLFNTVLVLACGPLFPMQLLDDRAAVLNGPPINSFAYEVARLVPPPAGLSAIADAGDGTGTAPHAPTQVQPADLDSQVGAAQAAARIAAAQTKLGCDGCERAPQIAAAHTAYARVRQIVAQGAPDPGHAAIASLGDEALLDLKSQADGQQCDYRSFLNDTPCAAHIAPARLEHAIRLYAQQAALNSDSGLQSLRLIASWAERDAARMTALLDEPVARRLLLAYALASADDLQNNRPVGASAYLAPPLGDGTSGPDHAQSDTADPRLIALLQASQKKGSGRLDDADRLAALAYRLGRYDLAAQLATQVQSPISSWVSAKLALRHGDLAAAAQYYKDATQGFPTLDASLDWGSASLLKGEQGVLALARGEYVEALSYLYEAAWVGGPGSGYDYDMSYVAERVLTTAELKDFIDARVPATPPPALQTVAGTSYPVIPAPGVGERLRYLLARRLVRDGRIDASLAYFPTDDDPRYDHVVDDPENGYRLQPAKLRSWARDYGRALHDAQHDWTRNGRAQAWFSTATIARQHGLEIMGYEQGPDYAVNGGAFDGGAGRQEPYTDQIVNGSALRETQASPQARAQAEVPGPYVTDEERHRYASSEAQPNVRFHYREIALAEAEQAADLLPPRSQAFAAVLCTAASWNVGEQVRTALYLRYVKQGAYVAFARHFGRGCPAPDFHAAARFGTRQRWRSARYWLHHHLYVALALVVALAAGSWWYRRYTAASRRP